MTVPAELNFESSSLRRVAQLQICPCRNLPEFAAVQKVVHGPSVWTGRALQVENDDLEKLVLRFCIRPHMMVSPSRADVGKQ
jgi:hypothetical protein